MDYVVFGTGYGATLMLLGWILRTFGPDFRYRLDDDEPPGGDFLLARISWRRFSGGLGALIATAGMAVVLVTFILILVNPSTSTGTWVAVAMFALTLVAAAVWTWLYVSQYGTFGILPEPKPEEQVFRSAPASEVGEAEPDVAPFVGPVALEPDPSPVGQQDEMPYEDEYDEPDYAEQFDEDEYDERRIRMSLYQSHLPDDREGHEDSDDVDTGHVDDEAGDEAADVDGATELDEWVVADEESDDQPGEQDILDDESGVPGESDEPEVEDEDPDPSPDDEDHTVDDPEADTSTGDSDEPDDDLNPGGHLDDTPEGRAEALRRIQSWNPEDPDKT